MLTNYLLDTYSARKLGLHSTGNASRAFADTPVANTTNFFLRPGTTPPGDIIRSVRSGLYVTELSGFGVNPVTGDYSRGAVGMWIESGELAYPVEEITIAGNLLDMFKNIEVIGNDLERRGTISAPHSENFEYDDCRSIAALLPNPREDARLRPTCDKSSTTISPIGQAEQLQPSYSMRSSSQARLPLFLLNVIRSWAYASSMRLLARTRTVPTRRRQIAGRSHLMPTSTDHSKNHSKNHSKIPSLSCSISKQLGLKPGKAAITEIAAVRVRHGNLGEEFHTLLNPGQHVPASGDPFDWQSQTTCSETNRGLRRYFPSFSIFSVRQSSLPIMPALTLDSSTLTPTVSPLPLCEAPQSAP